MLVDDSVDGETEPVLLVGDMTADVDNDTSQSALAAVTRVDVSHALAKLRHTRDMSRSSTALVVLVTNPPLLLPGSCFSCSDLSTPSSRSESLFCGSTG